MKTNNYFIVTSANPTAHFTSKIVSKIKDLFEQFTEQFELKTTNVEIQNFGASLALSYDEETDELDETAPYAMASKFEEFVIENASDVHSEIYEYCEYAEVAAA